MSRNYISCYSYGKRSRSNTYTNNNSRELALGLILNKDLRDTEYLLHGLAEILAKQYIEDIFK